ncbi:hypothetical protein YC2023_101853 [Brassica napus]
MVDMKMKATTSFGDSTTILNYFGSVFGLSRICAINTKEALLTEERKDLLIDKFEQTTGYKLVWKNIKNHYDSLKTWYTTYKRLSKKTGVHVNQTTNEIEMDSQWWDDRCNPLQDLDLLEKIFSDAYIGTEDGWAVGNGPDGYVQAEDHVNDTQTEGDDLQESFFFSETQNTRYNTPTNKIPPRRKHKGSWSSEKSEISMAYDRRSETIRVSGEAMGSDKESAICRVRQLSNIEYNSPFYWDVVSLIENSETARQMVLVLSDDEHVLNYLKRSIQVQKEPPCYPDFKHLQMNSILKFPKLYIRSLKDMALLWKILEDEKGDDFLRELEETDQRVMRPLCSDADCGRKFVHDLINGHLTQCHNMLRMWPEVFTKLCSDLQDMYGLRDTYNMSAKENMAIFLHMCGQNITQRTAMHTFGHSGEMIFRKFNEEELPNAMEQDLNSRKYMEGIRDEIANSIWARIR